MQRPNSAWAHLAISSDYPQLSPQHKSFRFHSKPHDPIHDLSPSTGDMSLAGPRLRQRQLRAAVTRRQTLYTSADDNTVPAPPPDTSSDDLKKPFEDECNKPMDFGRRDLSFWLALVFLVAPLYLVTPLSWAYTAYTARRLYLSRYHDVHTLSSTLAVWEWALFVYCVFEVSPTVIIEIMAMTQALTQHRTRRPRLLPPVPPALHQTSQHSRYTTSPSPAMPETTNLASHNVTCTNSSSFSLESSRAA